MGGEHKSRVERVHSTDVSGVNCRQLFQRARARQETSRRSAGRVHCSGRRAVLPICKLTIKFDGQFTTFLCQPLLDFRIHLWGAVGRSATSRELTQRHSLWRIVGTSRFMHQRLMRIFLAAVFVGVAAASDMSSLPRLRGILPSFARNPLCSRDPMPPAKHCRPDCFAVGLLP